MTEQKNPAYGTVVEIRPGTIGLGGKECELSHVWTMGGVPRWIGRIRDMEDAHAVLSKGFDGQYGVYALGTSEAIGPYIRQACELEGGPLDRPASDQQNVKEKEMAPVTGLLAGSEHGVIWRGNIYNQATIIAMKDDGWGCECIAYFKDTPIVARLIYGINVWTVAGWREFLPGDTIQDVAQKLGYTLHIRSKGPIAENPTMHTTAPPETGSTDLPIGDQNSQPGSKPACVGDTVSIRLSNYWTDGTQATVKAARWAAPVNGVDRALLVHIKHNDMYPDGAYANVVWINGQWQPNGVYTKHTLQECADMLGYHLFTGNEMK